MKLKIERDVVNQQTIYSLAIPDYLIEELMTISNEYASLEMDFKLEDLIKEILIRKFIEGIE